MTHVKQRMHESRCLHNGDAFSWSEELFIKHYRHLFCPSQSILLTLVVVEKLDGRNLLDLSQVNLKKMVLALVKWNQPHVVIIHCVVYFIDEFIECSVVTASASSLYRVHIPWFCINHVQIKWDRIGILIPNFYACETHIEQISPSLEDIYL